jgi:hypothetical protein
LNIMPPLIRSSEFDESDLFHGRLSWPTMSRVGESTNKARMPGGTGTREEERSPDRPLIRRLRNHARGEVTLKPA